MASLLAAFAPAGTVNASTPPVPPRKTGSIDALEQRLEQEREQTASLEKKLSNLNAELERTRKQLIDTAASVRKNEITLVELENRIKLLLVEEKELSERLEADYGSIANLVLALERIRRVPPESLIVRPGAPLETAQSAMLLRSVLPAVNQRADALSRDLERLNNIQASLERDRHDVISTKTSLEAEQKKLSGLIAQRERLYRQTQADYEQNQKNIERITREAENLRELMARLEEEEQQRREREKRSVSASPAIARSVPIPKHGQSRLPTTGSILFTYGEKDNIGATSQGLTIETSAGGLVVAPMGGVVKFAGSFKNYGQLVIIEHQDQYHSLISGMSGIDTSIGQTVQAGEPIGRMPSPPSSEGRPALYYELRHKGRPVHPAIKFAGLNS